MQQFIFTPTLRTLYLILTALSLLMIGCQPGPAETSANTDRVQALLLIEQGSDDPKLKGKAAAASGMYAPMSKLKVPDDLAPQNKWVMFEGPVLENELVAYRVYLDSRHRYDIYGKRVNDLVMDTVSWNYHEIMDWGSDILKVGNSLGMGSPALWYQDSVYTLSQCENKIVKLVTDSDTFAQYKFDFQGFTIGEHRFSLTHTWSMKTGSPWSEICMEVKGQSLPEDVKFATGIVDHGVPLETIDSPQGMRAYTWGQQSYHEEDMGMALDFGGNANVRQVADSLSHVFVMENDGGRTCYRFMAAWSRDVQGISSANEFRSFLEEAAQ